MLLEEEVAVAKAALDEKKATGIKAYDVRGASGLANCFVVASGTAAPHLKALAAGVEGAMRKAGIKVYRVCGEPESGWMVIDCIDVVVHVFSPEARAYYGLEKLWDNAPQI